MKKRIDISPSNRKLKISEKADQLPVIHYIYCVHRHHSQTVPTTTLLNKDVIMKLDDIKKFANFEKWNRDRRSIKYTNKLEIKEMVPKYY